MSPEPKTSGLLAGNRESVPAKGGDPLGSGLRAILLLGFGGLLALLLYSGANALHTLRELHETEESARARSVERRRVLATLVLSASIYSDNMEAILLSVKPVRMRKRAGEVAKRAEQTRAALQAYPADRTAEEQALIEQLQKYLAEQDSAFRSASGWETRRAQEQRAQEVVSEEIIPAETGIRGHRAKNRTVKRPADHRCETGQLRWSSADCRIVLTKIFDPGADIWPSAGGGQRHLYPAARAPSAVSAMRSWWTAVASCSSFPRGWWTRKNRTAFDFARASRRSGPIARSAADGCGPAVQSAGQYDEKGQELVRNIKVVAERTVQTVRNMALLLRPSMLDDLGLVPAVEWYAREMSRRGEIEVEVRAENVSEDLPDPLKLCVYRMVQEALNNAQRHAHAKNARRGTEADRGSASA